MPDLGNSRRKLKIAIGAMLAATSWRWPFCSRRWSAPRTHGGRRFWNLRPNLQKNPRGGAADRHGQEARARQGSDRRFLQGPLCRQGLELLDELGKIASANGVRQQQAHYKEEDTETSGVIPVEIEGVFPETICSWCDSSIRWSGRRCSLKWRAWASPARAPSGQA